MARPFQLCVLALAGCLAASAATLEQLSMEQMTAQATSIVRATVAGSYTSVLNNTVYTHYNLRVAETWKGVSEAEVMIPGGTSGRLRQTFPGVPVLQTGGDYVLFLWKSRSTGVTHLLGLSQGVFEVGRHADGSPVATRAKIGEMILDAKGNKVADKGITLGLSDLKARSKAVSVGAGAQ